MIDDSRAEKKSVVNSETVDMRNAMTPQRKLYVNNGHGVCICRV